MADNNSFLRDFVDAFNEGYNSEDEKIKSDTASLGEKIVDGFVSGVVGTLLSPFNWFS